MEILDKIKQFIYESIQSLFEKQKRDLSLVIHREISEATEIIKSFVIQENQTRDRDFSNLQQQVFAVQQQLLRLEHSIDEVMTKVTEERENSILQEEASRSKVQPNQERVFYARMADCAEPLGFKVANLKDQEDGCAFKITMINDSDGKYEFVTDKSIHQELLSAFNPLISETSIYEAIPTNPSGIVVIEPGVVCRENEVFKIIKQQQVKFI